LRSRLIGSAFSNVNLSDAKIQLKIPNEAGESLDITDSSTTNTRKELSKCNKHSLAGSHSEKWKSSKTVSQPFLAGRYAAETVGKRSLCLNGRPWRTLPKMIRNILSRPSCLRWKKKT